MGIFSTRLWDWAYLLLFALELVLAPLPRYLPIIGKTHCHKMWLLMAFGFKVHLVLFIIDSFSLWWQLPTPHTLHY